MGNARTLESARDEREADVSEFRIAWSDSSRRGRESRDIVTGERGVAFEFGTEIHVETRALAASESVVSLLVRLFVSRINAGTSERRR